MSFSASYLLKLLQKNSCYAVVGTSHKNQLPSRTSKETNFTGRSQPYRVTQHHSLITWETSARQQGLREPGGQAPDPGPGESNLYQRTMACMLRKLWRSPFRVASEIDGCEMAMAMPNSDRAMNQLRFKVTATATGRTDASQSKELLAAK
ncbi:hypothetical protein IQ07DRAFT_597372 [Pyrenochaeta sp. DS3sAY3a]|nr:hypothetical protein IQ07DRAFT_597372 [Pyrenochaeta sp. DS3sAY3a]